jgi:BASS family bile acid:Na+ symporter
MRPLLEPVVVLLLTMALIRLDWRTGLAYLRRPVLAATIAAWLFLVTPVIIWFAGTSLGLAAPLLVAVVLNAASAPLASSVPFTQLLRLDAELAMFVVAVGTMLLPVTIAPLILWLLGTALPVAPETVAVRSLLFIGLPLLLAAAVRRIFPALRILSKREEMDGLVVLLFIVFALAITDGVTGRLLADPLYGFTILMAAFAVSISLHALSLGAFWWMGRRGALSMAVTAGNRNLAILLVLLGDGFSPDFALYVALGQIPIFTMPAVVNLLCRRLLPEATAEERS